MILREWLKPVRLVHLATLLFALWLLAIIPFPIATYQERFIRGYQDYTIDLPLPTIYAFSIPAYAYFIFFWTWAAGLIAKEFFVSALATRIHINCYSALLAGICLLAHYWAILMPLEFCACY